MEIVGGKHILPGKLTWRRRRAAPKLSLIIHWRTYCWGGGGEEVCHLGNHWWGLLDSSVHGEAGVGT